MRKYHFLFLITLLASGVLTSTALAQGGMFRGTVTDGDGNTREGATVIVEKADARPPRVEQITDSSGRFTMLGLNSGDWTLTVELEGFHPHVSTVTLRQGTNQP